MNSTRHLNTPMAVYNDKNAILCLPKWASGNERQAISTCRCIGSIGITSGACVGDGLVGEGGGVMRLRMRDRNLTERQMNDGSSKST